MNRVIISGRLGGDPEIKTFKDFSIAEMSVAVHKRTRTPEGEWVDTTQFFGVLARGKIAERVQKVLCKGCGVLVDGELRLEQWEDRATGAKRSRVLVEMKDFELLGGRSREESQERGEDRREYNQERPPQRGSGGGKARSDNRGRQYSSRDEGEYYGDYEQEF